MASAGYPQPPDIMAQQPAAPQTPPQSVFAAQPQPGQPGQPGGGGPGEVVQKIQGKLKELDSWASDAKILLDSFDPSLSVFLQPIAQAGLQLTQAIQEKAQRSGGGGQSPVIPPPNVAGAAGSMPPPAGV